jgi:hypothetical protein
MKKKVENLKEKSFATAEKVDIINIYIKLVN